MRYDICHIAYGIWEAIKPQDFCLRPYAIAWRAAATRSATDYPRRAIGANSPVVRSATNLPVARSAIHLPAAAAAFDLSRAFQRTVDDTIYCSVASVTVETRRHMLWRAQPSPA